MHFSGTFLNSIVAKRIAWMLFLAAFIPTALITGLADRTIHKILVSNDKKNLVEFSQNYGLDAFSNLTFARTTLEQISIVTNQSLIKIEDLPQSMFKSIVVLSDNGTYDSFYGSTSYQVDDLKKFIHQQQKSSVLVLPPSQKNARCYRADAC